MCSAMSCTGTALRTASVIRMFWALIHTWCQHTKIVIFGKRLHLKELRQLLRQKRWQTLKKKKVYLHYMDHTKVPMAGYVQADGSYLKGIEDYLPVAQYEREEHQCAVVDDILENWTTLSHDSKFHAILLPVAFQRQSSIINCLKQRVI